MTVAIHQLLPSFAYGDAIGGAVQRTRRLLLRLGFRSETFAEAIDPRVAGDARPASELPSALCPDDVVLYRLSIGSPLAQFAADCGARVVLVYHNVTPASYYAAVNSRVTYWLERGRLDLRLLAPIAELVIADSTFNLDEAKSAGARQWAVVPPPVNLRRLDPQPSVPVKPPVVLFVGRFASNKRHDVLIKALAVLRADAVPTVQLTLIGNAADTGVYVDRLRRLARRVDVHDAVQFDCGHIEDASLAKHYRTASVFACASEHEGFCVPLLEAMAFQVPIVAQAAGAVPETAGDAALLLSEDSPFVWAEALARTIEDAALREALAVRGQRRLLDFSEQAVEARFVAALRSAGITSR